MAQKATVVHTITIPAKLYLRVRSIAKSRGTTVSHLVREAVHLWLDNVSDS